MGILIFHFYCHLTRITQFSCPSIQDTFLEFIEIRNSFWRIVFFFQTNVPDSSVNDELFLYVHIRRRKRKKSKNIRGDFRKWLARDIRIIFENKQERGWRNPRCCCCYSTQWSHKFVLKLANTLSQKSRDVVRLLPFFFSTEFHSKLDFYL